MDQLFIGLFWLVVIGLDLICLWDLRNSRVEATARVLWVVWVVLAPLVGAISYFIVQPEPEDRTTRGDGLAIDRTETQRQRWSENIQR